MDAPVFSQFSAASTINRDKGVIYGVSLATIGPARGHGVECDAMTLEQLRACATKYKSGLRVGLNHGGDAREFVGTLQNLVLDGDRLRGDLHLLKSTPRRDYVLEIAETMAESFGLSVVFTGPNEERGGKLFARCVEIYACDIVAEPAANPTGLFTAQVDAKAAGKETTAMTSTEIQSAISLAVTNAFTEIKTEFTQRFEALDQKLSGFVAKEAFTAEIGQVKQLVETAKTEFTAKLADDQKRVELAAVTMAKAFTATVGTTAAAGVSHAGSGAGAAKPDQLQEFDALLTKHFKATDSKSRAWALAAAENPEAYRAFLAAGRRPSFAVAA